MPNGDLTKQECADLLESFARECEPDIRAAIDAATLQRVKKEETRHTDDNGKLTGQDAIDAQPNAPVVDPGQLSDAALEAELKRRQDAANVQSVPAGPLTPQDAANQNPPTA